MGPQRLVNNLNVTFMDIEEALLLYLDEYRICVPPLGLHFRIAGAVACAYGMGLPYEYSHGSLRFTLGHCNTKKDMNYLMNCLPGIAAQLREISPVKLLEQQHANYHHHK